MKIELIPNQINMLFEYRKSLAQARETAKKWCLTVWVALLVALCTNQIQIDPGLRVLFATIPICVFWLYEAGLCGLERLYAQQMAYLESLLAEDRSEKLRAEKVMFSLWQRQIRAKDKFKHFIYCAFRSETVIAFYLVIVFFNVLTFALIKVPLKP